MSHQSGKDIYSINVCISNFVLNCLPPKEEILFKLIHKESSLESGSLAVSLADDEDDMMEKIRISSAQMQLN